MDLPDEIIGLVSRKKLVDILAPGFITADSDIHPYKELHFMLDMVYLQFESKFLRCESLEQYNLQMSVVDQITQDCELKPGEEFGVGSVFEFISWYGPLQVTSISIYLDDNTCDLSKGLVRNAEFYFRQLSESIFFDPGYAFGIRIGTNQHKAAWLHYHHAPSKHLKEYIWTK